MALAGVEPALPAGGLAHRLPVFHPLTVERVEPLTDEAVTVSFAVPDELAGDYEFRAGQHLTLRRHIGGEEIRRTYSICAAEGSGQLRVAVKRLPGGMFSTWVTERLRPGEVVDVMTPTGRFTVELAPERARAYAAVAAGSGITPVLSLCSTILAVEPASTVTLLYGNRTTRDVMFLEELADLKDRHPDRFTLVHVLSREPQDVELFSGRLDADRLRRFLDTLLPPAEVDEWFLCGPFAMVEGAREALHSAGVPSRAIHLELFHVEGQPPRGTVEAAGSDRPAVSATVTLAGRSTSFDLDPRDTVLEGTLRVRPDAPFACKGGVCGTCRARLVAGEVEMERNYALEDDELAAGYVLACQSHPRGDRVVLDYDS